MEEKIIAHLNNSKIPTEDKSFCGLLRALGMANYQERTLDKTLQRMRRAGKIAFNRTTRTWGIVQTKEAE